MNQMQIKYAVSRIEDLFTEKVKALKEAYTTPAKTITEKERFELVKSGKVKIKENLTRFSPYTSIAEAYDFSAYVADAVLDKKYHYEKKKLEKAKSKVKDEIILGDENEAKKLIADFEKL